MRACECVSVTVARLRIEGGHPQPAEYPRRGRGGALRAPYVRLTCGCKATWTLRLTPYGPSKAREVLKATKQVGGERAVEHPVRAAGTRAGRPARAVVI